MLIEGPPEAEAIVPLLTNEDIRLPIALLFYVIDRPRWAVYFPLAEFSPEWQAIRWAAANEVPIRFIDLPASASLGMSIGEQATGDVMETLAEAAGFEDSEDWWEHLVEHRKDPEGLFAGVAELMSALREVPYEHSSERGEEGERLSVTAVDYEAMREAHMRQCIRDARGFDRVAVVCGAWHSPGLQLRTTAKHDSEILRKLPKHKVGATVVPWTFDGLTSESGYGAGARSPAFYELLWQNPPDAVPTQWLMRVAHVMRDEDLEASPASVIEAVRLSEALAALRGRPRPGLRELCEAADSVMIRDASVWALIRRKLIIGDGMGSVPDSVPTIPLQADLSAQQKRLRMKVDDTDRLLQLDLREPIDLERSHLLHRLLILDVPWGATERALGKKGTFHEHWRICWRPELTIDLIEASIHGNTVVAAATDCAIEQARASASLSELAALIERVLLADLSDAIEPVVQRLQEVSATQADVYELADSLPPLTAAVRYGTVRQTDAAQIVPILDAILTRLCVGLPAACVSLDDDAAAGVAERLADVGAVISVLADEEKTALWLDALRSVAELSTCHLLVAGRAERYRFDANAVDGDHLAQRLSQIGSAGALATETAAFVEGILGGSGAILLHHDNLFHAVDRWVVALGDDVFDETLPLIRRSFALFTKPERRQIGERVAGGAVMLRTSTEIDEARAARVLPIVRRILGVTHD